LDGVAGGHEELIMNEQDSDVNYQKSLDDSGTARPMCNSGGTEFSPTKGAKTHASHACSVGCPIEGAKISH